MIEVPADNTEDISDFMNAQGWYMDGISPSSCRLNQSDYDPSLPDEYLIEGNPY